MTGWEWLVVLVLFAAWECLDHAKRRRDRNTAEARAARLSEDGTTTKPKTKGDPHGARVR